MDAVRFDTITRLLGVALCRRRLSIVCGRVAITGVVGVLAAANEGEAKRKGGRRKKKKPQRTQNPVPPGCQPQCAGKDCGQNGCGGSCGACNGGTCAAGVCACPAGTDLCGGACRTSCGGARDPRDCSCCTDFQNLCSGPEHGGSCCNGICSPGSGGLNFCSANPPGAACAFGAQCTSGTCSNGVCVSAGSCGSMADYCADGTPTCGSAGFCLRPRGGGNSRCGVQPSGDACGCANDAQCAALGAGAFCALVSGSFCSCASGATSFCAVPR